MHLPPEILQMVFANLPKRDLKAARLTRRFWNDQILPLLFNSVFITATYADLEIADLVTSKYGRYVDTVVFSNESIEDCFDFTETQSMTADVLIRGKRQIDEEEEVFVQLCRTLKSISRMSRLVYTDSWRNTERCRCDQALFDATQRSHNPWNKPKSVTQHGESCITSRPLYPFERVNTQWNQLMQALANCNTFPKEFSTESSLRLTILEEKGPTTAITSKMFTILVKLQLSLYVNGISDIWYGAWDCPSFRQMLSLAKNLKVFHLSLDYGYREDALRDSGVGFSVLFDGCSLPQLVTLGLDHIVATEVELTKFLKTSPEVQNLEFKRFSLNEGDWISLLATLRDNTKVKTLGLDEIHGGFLHEDTLENYNSDLQDPRLESLSMKYFRRPKGSKFSREDVHDVQEMIEF